jgi:hypothetical protein
MVSEYSAYKVKLTCDYPEWWRYNVYIMAVGCDSAGAQLFIENRADRIYDVCYEECVREQPADYDRHTELSVSPCAYIDIYVYVVANTFPQSKIIRDSPPFPVTLTIVKDGEMIEEAEYSVNQWGGVTVMQSGLGRYEK